MPATTEPARPPGLLRRLGWLLLIWAGSVAALGAVGFAIRSVLHP
ncbi:DUF2474 family protein [Roseomonas sp. BN140053]